ncbi:MAG: glutamate racemase [Candidatus Omnitrophica bacterium]|nr:glutamate racemase [Candidatus Omnitrophota bacterium]
MSDTRPIGIFDSGMGGLTVVKEVIRSLPNEKIVYFGDTARVPYGPKSKETIIRFSIENILFLLKNNVKLIIVACNTASSVALAAIEKNFKVPIMGVIEPGVSEAARITKNKRIGIIGTKTTVKSSAYEQQLIKIDSKIKVFSIACPLFVPLVEEGWLKTKITQQIVADYLMPLKNKNIDTIILGCTHYPLLKSVIQEVLGRKVHLVDSARQVAYGAKQILEEQGLLTNREKTARQSVCFYVSDEPDNFAEQGEKFLGFALNKVRKVSNV